MHRNTLKLNTDGGKLVISYEISKSVFPRFKRYYIRSVAVMPNGDIYRVHVNECYRTAREAEKAFLKEIHAEGMAYFNGGAV